MVNFKAPYNKEDALSFLDKFLPEDFQQFDEKIEVDFKSQFVRNIKKIGEAPSLENLHIYEITHESENDPRVSLSKDSFRLLAHFNVRKALIFFVSKTSPNYRLSLVTVDLKWESGARVKREYSNPRRYSYFLGPDARVHTPNDFLIKKDRAEDTADLLSRFDVEIVTKEFFTKYKGLFEDVRGYLEKDHGFKIFAGKNNIDINTFAKKLLGQIVFCYFLQRKGWLGAERREPINKGDKDFMRSLFNRCVEGNNFYNDYLEHLFYGSLNNRAEGSSDFYRKHFDCQIPFLNGGLFEPPEDYNWEKSFVHIPDKIFSNKENTGILDVFDLYNFTVYEDDPIDREVSVDPEMLGKVFENLLPENLRKGQGTYYTPRGIVHYMCQESLINYLSTETKVDIDKIRDLVVTKHFERQGSGESIDRALQNIKVCDPACGSGAFLVGMLHEIVSIRRLLNPKEDEYHLKKQTIQNCIYGVDIDPGAVEIAKLRLWLSLVVDYELKDIEPLPNLDYKIMCGNSLLEELIIGEESIKLFDERLLNISKGNKAKSSLFNDEEFKGKSISAQSEYLQNQLKAKQKQMLKLHSENQLTLEKRKELDQEIEALNKELNPKSRKQVIDYHPTLFGDKAEKYLNLLKELHKQYFTEYDPRRKREKRKQIESIEVEFIKSSIKEKVDDIENRIKNLNMQDLGDRKQQAVLMKKKLEYLAIPEQIHNSQAKPYFLWKLNFFEAFQEKGGFDVVIANPPYDVYQGYRKDEIAELSRIDIYDKAKGGKLNAYKVFLCKSIEIQKRNGVLCEIFQNSFLADNAAKNIRKYFLCNQQVIQIDSFPERDDVHRRVFESAKMSVCILLSKNLCADDYGFMLNIWDDRYMSSATKTFFKISELIKLDPETVVIPSATKEEINILRKISVFPKLIEIARCYEGEINLTFHKKLLRPKKQDNALMIKGAAVQKWHTREKMSQGEIEYLDKGFYLKENSGSKSTHFEQQRIVMQGITGVDEKQRLKMTIIDKNIFCGNSVNYILISNLGYSQKYLLSLLNSKLLNWYFKVFSTNSNVNGYEVNNLPIPQLDNHEQKQFIGIVDKIFGIAQSEDYVTSNTKQAKVKEYERQIDQMVYKLYGLTKEEIEIVENSR